MCDGTFKRHACLIVTLQSFSCCNCVWSGLVWSVAICDMSRQRLTGAVMWSQLLQEVWLCLGLPYPMFRPQTDRLLVCACVCVWVCVCMCSFVDSSNGSAPSRCWPGKETGPEQVVCHFGITWAFSPSEEIKTHSSVQREHSLLTLFVYSVLQLEKFVLQRSHSICFVLGSHEYFYMYQTAKNNFMDYDI